MTTLRQKIQSPLWAVFFAIAYIISQSLIAYPLRSGDAGSLLIQIQFAYSLQTFTQLINSYTEAQIAALQAHLFYDHIHPLWYGGLAYCLTAWQLNRLKKPAGWNAVLWLALVMALMDVIENNLHQPILMQTTAATEFSVLFAALCASVKWSLAVFFLLLNVYWFSR